MGPLPVKGTHPRRRRLHPIGALPLPAKILTAAFLAASGCVAFFPFLVMLSTSFKPVQEVFRFSANILPIHPIPDNYVEVFRRSLMLRFLLNGVLVTGLTLFGQLLLSIPAAYAFARLSFPGKRALFVVVLAALVFPRYIAAVPNFLLFSRAHLINTYVALVVPFVGSPLGIFLLRQFFLQLPGEYFDAARIDGCGLAAMLLKVVLPLIRPAIGAFAIFSIVAHWNDFFWPLVVIQKSAMLTPPAGIVFFADAEAGTKWSVIMAASVVVIAPLVLAFLAARKQFISSLTHVALKG